MRCEESIKYLKRDCRFWQYAEQSMSLPTMKYQETRNAKKVSDLILRTIFKSSKTHDTIVICLMHDQNHMECTYTIRIGAMALVWNVARHAHENTCRRVRHIVWKPWGHFKRIYIVKVSTLIQYKVNLYSQSFSTHQKLHFFRCWNWKLANDCEHWQRISQTLEGTRHLPPAQTLWKTDCVLL